MLIAPTYFCKENNEENYRLGKMKYIKRFKSNKLNILRIHKLKSNKHNKIKSNEKKNKKIN